MQKSEFRAEFCQQTGPRIAARSHESAAAGSVDAFANGHNPRPMTAFSTIGGSLDD